MAFTGKASKCMMAGGMSSVQCAEASFSCAHFTYQRAITLILDAIVMASILVFAILVCLASVLAGGIFLQVLVLLCVVRISMKLNTPRMRSHA